MFSRNKDKHCNRVSGKSGVALVVRDASTREIHLKLDPFGNVELG